MVDIPKFNQLGDNDKYLGTKEAHYVKSNLSGHTGPVFHLKMHYGTLISGSYDRTI